jgi:hypothetical protein
MLWRYRATSPEQGENDSLERRQRSVDLERLRERRGARGADPVAEQADPVAEQATARREGSGNDRHACVETRPPSQRKARATYSSDVSKLNPFASLSLFPPLLSS